MISFDVPADVADLRLRVREFVDEEVLPLEADQRWSDEGVSETLRVDLVERARARGLLSPHAPIEYGGLGLDHRGMAIIFEAAGWSPLGPLALNIQPPDEGNINLLLKVGTPEQCQRWLPALVSGEIRSAFSMTETPLDGAGADPSQLLTAAHETAEGYWLSGTKYMITGFIGAALNIVMARTFDRAGDDVGPTMFLVDANAKGATVRRRLRTMDSNHVGGHIELAFEDVIVPPENVLGRVGAGFQNAQVRLGPARLTHCMRWLGQAARCHSIAAEHAGKRHSFGKTLLEHQGVGFMLADNEIALHSCRLAIWQAAWLLDKGDYARNETSMSKVLCSEALGQIVDRSLQILGSIGISGDTVIERIYRDIRPFRIYDGPSEVHRHVIAQRIAKSGPFDHYRSLG